VVVGRKWRPRGGGRWWWQPTGLAAIEGWLPQLRVSGCTISLFFFSLSLSLFWVNERREKDKENFQGNDRARISSSDTKFDVGRFESNSYKGIGRSESNSYKG